jgi:hypothetical protein
LGTAWPKVDNRSFSEREERLGEREREMIAFTAKKSQALFGAVDPSGELFQEISPAFLF